MGQELTMNGGWEWREEEKERKGKEKKGSNPRNALSRLDWTGLDYRQVSNPIIQECRRRKKDRLRRAGGRIEGHSLFWVSGEGFE